MLSWMIPIICFLMAWYTAVAQSDVPTNDVCTNAFDVILLGKAIAGSTVSATIDSVPACGSASESTSPGVWLKVNGTGNLLEAKTCSLITAYDTQISVFSGTCNELSCVNGNDDSCNLQSSVIWESELDSTYYIHVHGYTSTAGDFEIVIDEVVHRSVPTNDKCDTAINFLVNRVELGSTVAAAVDNVPACGESTASTSPGIWFFVVGEGTPLQASTCGATTLFDTQISIFSGSCDSLTCVTGNDDDADCEGQSTVSWVAQANTLYYILVHGYDNSFGDFSIKLEQLVSPSNDNCISAKPFQLEQLVRSSTMAATVNRVERCGAAKASTSPGVWFSVEGIGKPLEATTCGTPAAFDTQISIFRGSCDSLTCIDGNDDSCGFRSSVGWISEMDSTYYILVHGFRETRGSFGIIVREVVPPTNDDCKDALTASINKLQLGSTLFAKADDVDVCGSASNSTQQGVWYIVVGNGSPLQASTCTEATQFDTQITVFVGSCGMLRCVDGNDQWCGDQSIVKWESNINTQYYIFVHGYGNASGSFGLVIEDFIESPGPINDQCNSSMPLTLNIVAQGRTFRARPDMVKLCGGASAASGPGVWFQVTGTGTPLRVSTCRLSDFDTQLAVFEGSCDSLICLDGDDDSCGLQSAVSWDSEFNSVYYILVNGFVNDIGEFGIVVEQVTVASTELEQEHDPPENDNCPSALPFEIGSVEEGSTQFATVDGTDFCGDATRSTAPGIWYSVLGTGTSLRISSCGLSSYDTQLSVFRGDCNNLVCVNGNDDRCGVFSLVTWESALDATYYVLVHGYSLATGNFVLRLEEDIVLNNDCENATFMTIGGREQGSTVTAKQSDVPFCGEAGGSTAPGLWYSVNGTGSFLQASTCGFSILDTQISVFTGGCDDLLCVDGNDQFCGDQSLVIWESEVGIVYKILVHGYADLVGEFQIHIEEILPTPNENCTGAVLISPGDEMSGSTVLASIDFTEACSESTDSTAPGVWFKIVGNGHILRANTCDLSTNFDTQISVFSGSCVRPVCVAGDNDGCGQQSSVSWESEFGLDYYILVYGYLGAAGSFLLRVEDGGETNDSCLFAVQVTLGEIYESSTVSASSDAVPACGSATEGLSGGVWFSVVGTGNILEADTCDKSNVDTQISVFLGDCDNLICVDGNDDWCSVQSSVSWPSNVGSVYYVLVHGFGGLQGDFGILIDELISPANDNCQGALPVSMNGEVEGSTITARGDDVAACGTSTESTAAGVWFLVMGTGRVIETSTCGSSTGFDTQISVFAGSCEALVCVDGNDQFCGDGSFVTWESEFNAPYYILVHGYETAVGEFRILTEEQVSPSNDNCTGASTVALNEPQLGNTNWATVDHVPACGTASTSVAPGVWFLVIGTGTRLQASTCNSTSFDTQISVFTGVCSGVTCVVGNDDSCSTQSSVSWQSEVETLYYVLVHGFGFSAGPFVLVVAEFAELPRPINDNCLDAKALPLNELEEGTTISALIDNVDACGSTSNLTAPGVWYWIVGTGSPLRASTCDFASFDTQISIFVGNCNNLVCVDGNDQWCGDQSLVTWESESNIIYYILVYGYSNSTGDFALTIQEFSEQPIPENDQCLDALPLEIGAVQAGATTSATVDNVTECGGASPSIAPGVWFSIQGTGESLQVNTCGFATFDTQISVFEGTCDELICVDGNDDLCGMQSFVAWDTELDSLYYILVHGYTYTSGDFFIVVEESEGGPQTNETSHTNDDCVDAVDLLLDTVTASSTLSATVDFANECGTATTSTAPGVWFSVMGTGDVLRATTCGLAAFDTQVSIYRGSCNNLICVDGNDDWCSVQSTVSWESQLDSIYYILVHGFGSSRGVFNIVVEDAGPKVPTRSPAPTPSPTTPRPTTSRPTTPRPTTARPSTPRPTTSRPTTPRPTSPKPVSPLLPISTQSPVPTEKPLQTPSSAPTDFRSPTPAPVTTNNTCDHPNFLAVGERRIFSTASASINRISDCGKATEGTAPGLWFSVMGTGNDFQLNTCGMSTTFDTQISVFAGSCENLICVEGNDDTCETQSNVVWNSEPFVAYHILVHGYEDASGTFLLSFIENEETVDVPINDRCENAARLLPGERKVGSTSKASSDQVAVCGTASDRTAPGVWFSVVGTGEPLLVSTCDSASYDTQITLFEGSCDNLVCMDGNDQWCGDQSLVIWNSVRDSIYYVLVHGYDGQTGDFGIFLGGPWVR